MTVTDPTLGYDPELRMFRETAKAPDIAVLRFLRWLGERGRLEHAVLGPPTGAYSAVVTDERGHESRNPPHSNGAALEAMANAIDLSWITP